MLKPYLCYGIEDNILSETIFFFITQFIEEQYLYSKLFFRYILFDNYVYSDEYFSYNCERSTNIYNIEHNKLI